MDFRPDGIDGFLDSFGADLARFAFVRAGGVGKGGDAVLLIAAVPRLDRAPGELALAALLVGEEHLADGFDAGADGVAFGHVDGAEHAHFEVRSWIFHQWFLLFELSCRRRMTHRQQFQLTGRTVSAGWLGWGVPFGVVAGWRKTSRAQPTPQLGQIVRAARSLLVVRHLPRQPAGSQPKACWLRVLRSGTNLGC